MSKLSVPVSEKDHVQGDSSASCTLVEYGDYQCPSCGQAYPIVKQLQKHFGGQMLFVFRNFPLSQIHPWAEPAAEVAEFAAKHGKFWEMHDLLYENQESFGRRLFSELAATLSLPDAELTAALAHHTFQTRVHEDFSSGIRSGVNGTPTFFIAGQRHNDSYDFETLRDAIDAELSRSSS